MPRGYGTQESRSGVRIDWTRRDLIGDLMVGLGAVWLSRRTRAWRRPGPSRIGVIRRERKPWEDGIEFGVEEAARSSRLFGVRVETRLEACDRPTDVVGAARALASDWGAMMVVMVVEDETWCAKAAPVSPVPILNGGCSSNELRQRCLPNLFHVAASDEMLARPLGSDGSFPSSARVLQWSDALERFGASQLNHRFEARYARPMSGMAWAGWLAVKIAAETLLRVPGGDAEAIRAYLIRETTRFDGHKGAPLSFRRSDHQLLQPLYLVDRTTGRLLGETPEVDSSLDRGSGRCG
jgi:hypothetical protein